MDWKKNWEQNFVRNQMKAFVVTGIGTGIGKTVCSAVLCEALQADFWKPIQAGDLHALDSDFVKENTSNSTIIPERWLLSQPLSPHESARIDGITLHEDDFELPEFQKTTIIEGAGGVMVPLNEEGCCFVDLFQFWHLPVFVVTKHYLGSINHTLLTLSTLFQREIEVAGLIVNGNRLESTERIYKAYFPSLKITYIPEIETFSKETIAQAAQLWNEQQH